MAKKTIVPEIPKNISIPVKEEIKIPLFKDQIFETSEERKLWIIEQCKKFGYSEYTNAQIKGHI